MKSFLSLIMCFLISFSILSFSSFADVNAALSMTPTTNQTAQESVNTIGKTILSVVQVVGTVLGIVLLVIFGIRFLTAGPAQKAKLKEEAIGYVVGAIFLFGCSGIASIVYNVVGDSSSTTNAPVTAVQ